MPERKWGAIANGATFECLATTIVFFEDPKAALFGRRGKDGGQDARSGDGSRVFQAKHHENGSAAAAIRDAKSEAKTIAKYRQAGHSRYEQWTGVTHWRLVTNAAFNPTDKSTWDREVVPLFAKLGLIADYWERENLNALLDKHPEIHRSFFENETRVFLSIAEAKDRLPGQEPFLRRDDLAPFCGRRQEITTIGAFLISDRFFLVVHGAGGIGKTRLLVEAGEEIAAGGQWQVLWANIASMAATGKWFEAVVPERPTVLIVDEPSDELVLQQLAEQLGGRVGRVAQWKVVVAVRSPKDPVLRFLRGARIRPRVQELPIPSLPTSDAEAMCMELLATGPLRSLPDDDRREAARQLARRFHRHPIWLTLAVQHLESHGNLKQVPADAEALADEYLNEIEHAQSDVSPESVRRLLRWVALVGTVNREDDTTIKLIGDGAGIESAVGVREQLASLVRRRALVERGARDRFVEVKPDVLRDHILHRWLTVDVGGAERIAASDDAKTLLDSVRSAAISGALSGLGQAILVSLARTEFLLDLAGYQLELVKALFVELDASVPSMSASQRLALADVIEAIAPFYPRASALLAGSMRRVPAPEETIEGLFATKTLGQGEVILALAWPLFGAAMGADSAEDREVVLRELCALTEAEAELMPKLPHGLPNDGKRAGALVTRTLEGGPLFRSEYDDTATKLCLELLENLEAQPPTRGQIALLKALVEPILSVERRQSWSDDRSFSWRTFAIAPGSPAWSAREAVLGRVKAALEQEQTPEASRVKLWHVFARARDGAALQSLSWTYDVLASRSATLDELAAAREVWDWYRRFEKDPQRKAAADRLEALYTTHELAKEFEPLVNHDDWKAKDVELVARGAALAQSLQLQDIADFVDRAVAFLGQEHKLYTLSTVAWSLGEHAEESEIVRQFVASCLGQPVVTPRTDFGVTAVVRWVSCVRLGDHPERAHVLVAELLGQCASDQQRANLLQHLYGRIPKLSVVGEFTAAEHELVRSSRALFFSTGRGVAFVGALALTIGHAWVSLRPLLEDALRAIPTGDLPLAIYTLVDGIYWAVSAENAAPPPSGLAQWLMTQLLLLPDLDALGGNGEWHLTEIIKRIGNVDVRWLPEALARRQQQEATAGDDYEARAIGYDVRISKYVRKISHDDANDAGVLDAVMKVLDFAGDNGTVGYYLPEVLRDIDPDGIVVPAAVAQRASTASDAEAARRLARIGGAYAVNSTPWRTIALAAIRAAAPGDAEALRAIYGALSERGIRSWSSGVGEVPDLFRDAVDEARKSLGDETDSVLRPFWQLRLQDAESELRGAEERAKEERGE